MVRAMDIANFVILESLRAESPITHLHLQKTLYFLEGAYLVTHRNDTLLDEDIEKWKLGPVIPDVYHEYKTFGARVINFLPRESYFDLDDFSFKTREFDQNSISREIRDFISPRIHRLLEYHEYDLVNKTHEHEPWKRDESLINRGTYKLLYDKNELRSFFLNNVHYLEEMNLVNV